MKHSGYVNNRVLKLNVGFLLTTGPGHNHNSTLDIPAVRVTDDLILNYIRGPLRLSRTKEGILVQAQLQTSLDDECHRCLDPIDHEMTLKVEELYAYHTDYDAEFRIDEDGILDLAPLLREEVLIERDYSRPCQLNEKGVCNKCGRTLSDITGEDSEDPIDPRFAELKKLLDS